jgi:hypothetical protein
MLKASASRADQMRKQVMRIPLLEAAEQPRVPRRKSGRN